MIVAREREPLWHVREDLSGTTSITQALVFRDAGRTEYAKLQAFRHKR